MRLTHLPVHVRALILLIIRPRPSPLLKVIPRAIENGSESIRPLARLFAGSARASLPLENGGEGLLKGWDAMGGSPRWDEGFQGRAQRIPTIQLQGW
jgi:hypothetical protein